MNWAFLAIWFFALWLFDLIFYRILLKRGLKREAELRKSLMSLVLAIIKLTASIAKKESE